jgi:hypothetical protein
VYNPDSQSPSVKKKCFDLFSLILFFISHTPPGVRGLSEDTNLNVNFIVRKGRHCVTTYKRVGILNFYPCVVVLQSHVIIIAVAAPESDAETLRTQITHQNFETQQEVGFNPITHHRFLLSSFPPYSHRQRL